MRSTIELGNATFSAIHAARSGSLRPGEAQDRGARDVPVALDVVAGHHRERRHPASRRRASAAVTKPERWPAARRRAARSRSAERVARVELAGDVVDAVAALGDRQRDDARGRVGEALEDRGGVVRRVQVLEDRADHPRLAACRRDACDERVEVVLRGEDVAHPPVPEDADAADGPVARASPRSISLREHRLVGAMESADAEVHDACGQPTAIVRRHSDRRLRR